MTLADLRAAGFGIATRNHAKRWLSHSACSSSIAAVW